MAADPLHLDAEDFTALTVTEDADRLHAKLNRPEVRNAIDSAMISELHAVCDYLEASPKILILSGTESGGKGIFASGADIGQLRQRRRDDALRGINSAAFDRLAKLPMPVIAALDAGMTDFIAALRLWGRHGEADAVDAAGT